MLTATQARNLKWQVALAQISPTTEKLQMEKGYCVYASPRLTATLDSDEVVVTFLVRQKLDTYDVTVEVLMLIDDSRMYLDPKGAVINTLLPLAVEYYESTTGQPFPAKVVWEYMEGQTVSFVRE
jgi:hypothetical protein